MTVNSFDKESFLNRSKYIILLPFSAK